MFIKNCQNFLKISQQFVFFVQTCKKLNAEFVNIFEKYAKTMHCLQFSEVKFREFCQNFQIIVFLVQRRKELTHGLLNVFEKYAKIIHFRNFPKKNVQNFREFSQNLE